MKKKGMTGCRWHSDQLQVDVLWRLRCEESCTAGPMCSCPCGPHQDAACGWRRPRKWDTAERSLSWRKTARGKRGEKT
jgi:hypothetical protein